MPIIVPENLPTRWMLESEGVFVMDRQSAKHHEASPLRVAVLDLSGSGELPMARQIGASPNQVELTVLVPMAIHAEVYRPLSLADECSIDESVKSKV